MAGPTERPQANGVRIDPATARERVESGQALLVCAYEDEAKCRKYELAGSISLRALEQRLTSLSREQEMVFYCA